MNLLEAELKTRVSNLRCYKCGDEKIEELCHHCGRAMCKAHRQPNIPWWVGGKHVEFADLGLQNHPAGAEGKHCDECLHFTLSRRYWGIVGAVVSLLLAWLLSLWLWETLPPLAVIFWLLALLFGGIAGVIFSWVRNEARKWEQMPLLPLTGRLVKLSAAEEIKGKILLDPQGNYEQTRFDQGKESGTLGVGIKFDSLDRHRLKKYKNKFGKMVCEPVEFHAGFFILNGRSNLTLAEPITGQKYNHTMPLKGTIDENRFLSAGEGGKAAEWSRELTYHFEQKPPKIGEMLPVQIIPRVVRQGQGWSLELLVQITPNMGIAKLLAVKMLVKELILQVTPKWGEPKVYNEHLRPAHSEDPEKPYTQLTWENIKLPDASKDDDASKKGELGRRKQFFVRFEQSITPELIEEPLKGRLTLQVDYAFSGIKGLEYFYATGRKHDLEGVKKDLSTKIVVDFEFDLHSLLFQKNYHIYRNIRQENLIPDEIMVRQLSDALAEDNVYVQRIIENEPRTSLAGAKLINRYWRVEGRKYAETYPIDFHIVVTGQEQYEDKDVPEAGTTLCDMQLFALVFNNEMEEQVDGFAEQLESIVEGVLGVGEGNWKVEDE